MDYDLNKTQTILKDEAHRFLAKECPSDFVREMAEDKTGYSKELWQKMAELDWMGVLIPEQYGGMGGNFLDLTVLLSEMGYSCLPGPFFSCIVLGGLTILEAGSDSQKADVLPALSRGEQILSLAWLEQDGTYVPGGIKLAANLNGEEYILNGTKLFVPYAHVADTFICVARTRQTLEDKNAGLTLFLVNAKQQGIYIETLITMAGDRQCEVIFKDVTVSKDNILGQLDQGGLCSRRYCRCRP
jgi:alkylation response protein AidB-like acyl-CoA dehydrogenase